MKKLSLTFLLLFTIIVLLNSFKLYNTQQQQAKLPVPMIFPKVVQGKSVFYIISEGNSDNFNTKLNLQNNIKADTQLIIYECNPSNPLLKKVTDAPFSRIFFGACSEGDKIYIAGGFDIHWKPTNSVYEYNITTKKWTTKKPMHLARANFAMERIGKNIYILGGGNGKDFAEKYSIETDKWSILNINIKPKLETIFEVYASTAIENKIFLFGKTSKEFQVFSTESNSLEAGLSTPFTCEQFSITAFSKRIYLSGGTTEGIASGKVYLYDYVENAWSTVGKIPFPRFWSGLISYNGMLIHLGGVNNNSVPYQPTNEIYIYRPMR